ncbi:hypothetical protein ABIA44_000726 [Bradyrhizobium sp. USDA 329]
MRDRRVDGDDEIKRRDGRRRIGEIAEGGGKIDDIAVESREDRTIVGARLLLQTVELHARHHQARQHGLGRQRALPVALVPDIPGPGHADLQGRHAGERSPPAQKSCGIGMQIRNVGRNGVERGAEHARQAHQRQLQVERRQRFAARDHGHIGQRSQQGGECGLHLEDDISAPRRHHRQIAHEMQRVAEPVFGKQQQCAAIERLPLPFRLAECGVTVRERLGFVPPPIRFEAIGEVTVHQQQVCVIVLGERLLGIERNRMTRDRERLVDLSGIAQRHRQIGVALGIARIGGNRAAMGGNRVGDALLLFEDDAEIGVGRRVIGLEQQSAFTACNRLIERAELGVAGAEIGCDHMVRRIERKCPSVDLGSLAQLTILVQDEAEQAQRRDVVRPKRDGAAVLLDGVPEQSLPIERRAKIAEQPRIVRIGVEGATIGGRGLVQPVLVRKDVAEIEPGAAISGLARNQHAIGLFRFGQPSLLGQRDGEVETRPRQMRIEHHRTAIGDLGLAETRELAERHAKLVVKAGVVRAPAERPLERGHGPLMLALHRQRIAQRDQRWRVVGIDVEEAAEQRGAVGGTIRDEGGDGGQMQRREVIRLGPQDLLAQGIRLLRPARRKMLRRLHHDRIHSRIAHDTPTLSRSEMQVERARSKIPSVRAHGAISKSPGQAPKEKGLIEDIDQPGYFRT